MEPSRQRVEPDAAVRPSQEAAGGRPAADPVDKVLDLQRMAGNAAVTGLMRQQRQLVAQIPVPPAATSSAPTLAATSAPWLGVIKAAWNAALRRTPTKNPDDPYANGEVQNVRR